MSQIQLGKCGKQVDWADYSWNPIIGCKHNCSYCYAKKLNDRYKFVKEWTEPELTRRYFEIDNINFNLKIPANRKPMAQAISPDRPIVFVGDMTDMFGDWVDYDVIRRVMNKCSWYPNILFMFLTKNWSRILAEEWHKEKSNNVLLGATATDRKLNCYKHIFDFISIEPLLGVINPSVFESHKLKFVIVGAMTGANAIPPKKEWIESIKHPVIYWKNNIQKYLEQ